MKNKKAKLFLEIGENSIKALARFSKKDKASYVLLTKATGAGQDPSEEIVKLCQELGIKPRSASLIMPRHLLITRLVRLPSTKEDEIGGMARTEAVKQTPYMAEEIIPSFKVVKKFDDGYSSVLLVIAQRSMVRRCVETMEKARIGIDRIAFSSEALSLWCRQSLAGPKGKEEAPGADILVNMDRDYAEIAVLEDGEAVFTRGFAHGPENNFNPGASADEIMKSVAKYKKENARVAIRRLLLTGSGNYLDAVKPFLSREEALPSAEDIAQDGCIGPDKEVRSDLKEHSFAALIGLAMSKEATSINLLPEDILKLNETAVLKKALRTTVILLISSALVIGGLFLKGIMEKVYAIKTIDARMSAIEPKAKEARRLSEAVKMLKREFGSKPLAADILSELYKKTPSGITFSLIEYEDGKSLLLKGSANSLGDVIKLIQPLEGSPYFDDVKLRYTTKRQSVEREITDFEITCGISAKGRSGEGV